MLHDTSTPKADGKVKELGSDTAQTDIRRWEKKWQNSSTSHCVRG